MVIEIAVKFSGNYNFHLSAKKAFVNIIVLLAKSCKGYYLELEAIVGSQCSPFALSASLSVLQ